MATGDDPFTVVQAQLWAMLESNSGFTDLVKAGNRIKFDEDDPIKSRVGQADKPEVRLVPVSLGPDEASQLNVGASNTAFIVLESELQISTGQVRLVPPTKAGRENVFRVLWEAIRSTWSWRTHLQGTMTWGTPTPVAFNVHRLRATAASIGVLESDLTRGIDGWSSLMQFEVAMNFGIAQHEP